jgi:hypothetical protein
MKILNGESRCKIVVLSLMKKGRATTRKNLGENNVKY